MLLLTYKKIFPRRFFMKNYFGVKISPKMTIEELEIAERAAKKMLFHIRILIALKKRKHKKISK